MQCIRKGTRQRWYGVILASLVAGSSVVSGQAASVPQLTLSQVLDQAARCGPAFREYVRRGEQLQLNQTSETNERMPAWRITLGTRLTPEAQTGAVATMDWQLTDQTSVTLTLPAGAPLGASNVPATKRLSVNWSKAVWPTADAALEEQIDAREQHISKLAHLEMRNAAVRDVVVAFNSLRYAHTALDIAERHQTMAQGRADNALARYERGLIALRDLQAEQNALNQANTALQRAIVDTQRASERLATLLEGCVVASGDLVDDIDWEAFVQSVTGALDVPLPVATQDRGMAAARLEGDVWEERLLMSSATYQGAEVAALGAEQALTRAEGRLGPSVTTTATATSNLETSDVAWTAGLNVVWDLAPNRQVDLRTAQINLEAAQDRLQQAREAALEAGRTAWLAVADGMNAVELAESALGDAMQTQRLVEMRVEAGLAPVVERDEAQLEVDRRALELGQAWANLRLAWLDLAYRLGLEVEL